MTLRFKNALQFSSIYFIYICWVFWEIEPKVDLTSIGIFSFIVSFLFWYISFNLTRRLLRSLFLGLILSIIISFFVGLMPFVMQSYIFTELVILLLPFNLFFPLLLRFYQIKRMKQLTIKIKKNIWKKSGIILIFILVLATHFILFIFMVFGSNAQEFSKSPSGKLLFFTQESCLANSCTHQIYLVDEKSFFKATLKRCSFENKGDIIFFNSDTVFTWDDNESTIKWAKDTFDWGGEIKVRDCN
ncbi:hypothetical protein [Sulfurimonas sp.]|uniref:hypothetical protein n=1 Tax=Sulfurimonas sp. TaxID=2022749 RepID=UPI002B476BD5|nr:hypothetical protein [Sulfurimonas sp.]